MLWRKWRPQLNPPPQFYFGTGNGTVAGVTLGSTSFGYVTSASGQRILQLGAKLSF